MALTNQSPRALVIQIPPAARGQVLAQETVVVVVLVVVVVVVVVLVFRDSPPLPYFRYFTRLKYLEKTDAFML